MIIFHQNHLKAPTMLLESEDTAGDGIFMISASSYRERGKPASKCKRKKQGGTDSLAGG